MHTLPPYAVTSPVRLWRRWGWRERFPQRAMVPKAPSKSLWGGGRIVWVYVIFRPLEVRRHLVNTLPKGAVNLVPLRTSTSGSVSEVQYTIKPLLYIFQCIRLRNLRNLHKLKHSNNRIAYNSKNNHLNKTASSYHIRNISSHRSVQI